jgi:hypothetical protein
MRTILGIEMDATEHRRSRPFGVASLGLGALLLAGSVLLFASEIAIAMRIHEENVLQAQRPVTPMSFSLKSEIHDFGAVGLAYLALHAWVLWAVVCLVRKRVERHRRVGLVLLCSAVSVLLAEHAVRAWLNHNNVYIGIPLEVFFPW